MAVAAQPRGLLSRLFDAFKGGEMPSRPAPVPKRGRPDSTYNPLTMLGTGVDKGSVGRPNPWILSLTAPELQVLWEHNGIARRIVEILPARACRRGWTVPDIGEEDSRLQTWSRVQEALTMARLYGGSVLLMVTEDDVALGLRNADYLRTPLDLDRIGRVAALQVFDATEAAPGPRWDDDPRSPNFRGPAEWQLRSGAFYATVHASRVIWFRGARRPPGRLRFGSQTGMPDDSCIQAIWDEIRRLTETLQGGAVMAQELRESILKMANLGSTATGDEAAEVETQLALMGRSRGLLNMTVIGPDDDFQSRSNPPTGFKELSSGAWEALAAVTGIPQVILMGSTPGGLNTDGESSWEGFRQLCSTFQETELRHNLERLYTVILSAQDGPTNGQVPDPLVVTFAPLDEPREAIVAETRKMVAETDQIYVNLGVLAPEDVTRARFGPDGYSFELGAVEVPDEDEIARLVNARNATPLQVVPDAS